MFLFFNKLTPLDATARPGVIAPGVKGSFDPGFLRQVRAPSGRLLFNLGALISRPNH
jgi:hypothetical protein